MEAAKACPVKTRNYLMLGFGAFASAKRLCKVVDELKRYLRARRRMKESVCLSEQRTYFRKRVQELRAAFTAAQGQRIFEQFCFIVAN